MQHLKSVAPGRVSPPWFVSPRTIISDNITFCFVGTRTRAAEKKLQSGLAKAPYSPPYFQGGDKGVVLVFKLCCKGFVIKSGYNFKMCFDELEPALGLSWVANPTSEILAAPPQGSRQLKFICCLHLPRPV